ncbi:hypothetical protein BSLG_010659 [Batrachochytrium salamandrivorans]|nr:hypothetical protein BSLG_010659 [Batrachochytrium salamandrivorans]
MDIAEQLPVFPVIPEAVSVIDEPIEFRDALKMGIRNAHRRIVLASLYIGASESELIDELHEALKSNGELTLTILVDHFRGSRIESNGHSTTTLLMPLQRHFPGRVTISLYRSPSAQALWMKMFPQRLNEVFGLQHIKAYIFDDDVLISGANLSNDYFTNRQDRYVLFKNTSALATYFTELIHTLGSLSGGSTNQIESARNYRRKVHTTLKEFSLAWIEKTRMDRDNLVASFGNIHNDSEICTYVAPAIQLGCAEIRYDQDAMLKALSLGSRDHRLQITVASGYLNFPSVYRKMLYQSRSDIQILCSSPQANGFFNSKGVSKYVPVAYSYLELLFTREFSNMNKLASMKIWEYFRAGWTWHAKGLWIHGHPHSNLPYITTIGSSNMNQRSLELDMEAQIYLFTRNSLVRSRFQKNFDKIFANTQLVQLQHLQRRYTPFLVKLCATVMRTMF